MPTIIMDKKRLITIISNAIAYGNNELESFLYDEDEYNEYSRMYVNLQIEVGNIPEFQPH